MTTTEVALSIHTDWIVDGLAPDPAQTGAKEVQARIDKLLNDGYRNHRTDTEAGSAR